MVTSNSGELRPAAVVRTTLLLLILRCGGVALHPTTSPPVPTTVPLGCETDEGEKLYPGQQITTDGGCRSCSCSLDSQLVCYYADCLAAMCVDQYKPDGVCCGRCPNGRNCRIPATGEVISAGRPVHRDGMVCECPPQNYMLSVEQTLADITAICHDMTTTPLPTDLVPVGRR